MRTSVLCTVAVLAAVLSVKAADYYVDNVDGRDTYDGRSKTVLSATNGPLATITKALNAAGPGDTVHLNPTRQLYRQMADFYGLKGGEPGKPLVLDGHDATLSGADVCPPDGWKEWKAGVLQREDIASYGFMLIDGAMVFETLSFNVLKPGEFCYMGPLLNFCAPDVRKLAEQDIEVGQPDGSTVKLDPAKWHQTHSRIPAVRRYPGLKAPTWIKLNGTNVPLLTAKERLTPGNWCQEAKSLYFFPPTGKKPSNLAIECVVRGNGVQMSGDTAHVVVTNLNVQNVYNDGFNIHGHVTHAEFYDCNAHDCGDEGFSAHDNCETVLDGAVYVNCDNGIANVNERGFAITRNVILQAARSVGYLLQGAARYELENAILIDNPNQFSGNGRAENVLIIRTPAARCASSSAIGCGGETALKRITCVGNQALFRTGEKSNIKIEQCLFGASQGVLHVRADDPMAILHLNGVIGAEDLKMEWSSQYPWKSLPLREWLAKATEAGIATNCATQDLTSLDALREGRKPESLPAGAGCDITLIDRYVNYLRQSAQK